MSIYNIENEPVVTDPQALDLILVYDASTKTTKSMTLSALIAYIGSGGAAVDVTAATLVLTRALHAGRVVTLNRSGGIDVTLPAATGSGDAYDFFIGTATTDAYTFTRTGDDTIAGLALANDGDGAPANGWATTAATVVSLGGTAQATGGSVGDRVQFKDVAADLWQCTVFASQGGTEATPFA